MKKNMQICRLSYLQSFTAKIFITLSLFCPNQLALAQLEDHFSDNDFTSDPPWSGDESKFIVQDERLQLNAPVADGFAYLSTASVVTQNAAWEFRVSLEFNPSSGNYARIYLLSDQFDLSGPLNGYFVMVGGSSDDVSLYKQTGLTYSKIIDGRDGVVNLSSVDIAIRVTRDKSSKWELFSGTAQYTLEGTAIENTLIQSTHFGILCAYTSSRSDKFFFDDFTVREKDEKDEVQPLLKSVEVLTSRKLKLFFSEPLSEQTVTPANFSVSHGVGVPEQAILEADRSVITLSFKDEFPSNVTLLLAVAGVADLSNNVIQPFEKDFLFTASILANAKDLIITEIYADPSPTVGLPAFEFVEIFNRSGRALNLLGWTITDQSSVSTLPDFTLLPNEYCVLTTEGAEFSDIKNTLYFANFPSLNNGSDILVIADDSGRIIDSLQYSQSWYQDDDKENGGWSLEIIDPSNICSERENWTASEAPRGGSPGFQNSVFAHKPDLTGPTLASIVPMSATLIHLQFDEKLETPLSASITLKIEPMIPASSISFADGSLTSLEVALSNELKTGVIYTLGVDNIYDCSGNLIQELSNKQFGLPEVADSLDLSISEILFNPKPTGVDFIEIVNVSSKFINLKDWSVASLDDGVLKEKAILTSENLLLYPKQVLAITVNKKILKSEYLLSDEQNFLEVVNLPAFNDDYGTAALLNAEGAIIDQFAYTKDMHSIFLKDDEGVSLERISSDGSNGRQNWKSASATVGFATPGYLNSNVVDTASPANPLTIEPEIFNPLSGTENFALIHYNLEQGGYVANIKVFDAQGRAIKQIANNVTLSADGFYRWDGDRDDGTKANVGYYMIWFEIFNDQGSIKRFLGRVAVATTF